MSMISFLRDLTGPAGTKPSQQVSESQPLPVAISAASGDVPVKLGAWTDHSGTIAAANVAQQVCAANATRRYFLFQNISDTDMWINFGVTAVENQPSVKVTAGGQFVMEQTFINTDLVSVICTANTKAFVSKEG